MLLISFILQNSGTIIVAAAVAALVIFLIAKLIRDKRAGKSGCSCGCSSCPMSSGCPSVERNSDNNK